jgi:SAM-dependent methyltransferase
MIHRLECDTTRPDASYPWAAGKVVKILGGGSIWAMFRRVSDTLLGVLGWRSLLIHGDPCVLDRWLWLRRRLRHGNVRTFDAGCGNGGFSIYAARAGNEVVAASFSSGEQQAAHRRAGELGVTGIDFRTLDLRELEHFRDSLGSFDQIICFETIEHVLDDVGLVSRLAALLRPAGQLLLTAPFAGHHPLYTEERNPSGREDGSHVRYGYSQERLRQLAQGAGLRVLDEGLVSGVVSQKLTDLLRRLSERIGRPAAWAIVLPVRALVVLDTALTRMLRYPYLSVALCAVKPA